MRVATENDVEYKKCMLAFEKRERKFYDPNALSKRREKVLKCGEGRYLDDTVNMRWMTWRACWDLLQEDAGPRSMG